jgi:hypothetical protein
MAAPNRWRPGWRPRSIAIGGLILVATVAFALASLIHFGVALVLGPLTIDAPFAGAAIPEAVLALLLCLGLAGWFACWPAGRGLALATTVFALLVTLYGLTVTVRSARSGDVTYHVSILVVLAALAVLLFLWTPAAATLDA